MRLLLIIFAIYFISRSQAGPETGNKCPPREHWVSPHHRRAYTRGDGTVVKATDVKGHCRKNSGDFHVWNLKLRNGKQAQLSEFLGRPSEIVNFKDLPDSKETGTSWKYEENGLGRLTIFFDEGAEIASSWIWHVYDGDPEQNIKTAMSRYAPASWEPETDKWINPHNHPNECYFKEKKNGVSIEYNRTRKEVFSIARWDPSRKLASDKDEKRPVFCIENSCSPAYSAEEFFKGSSVSKYCELPK